MEEQNKPQVFISYSWSSDSHKQRVLNLAKQLFKDGVYVHLDVWDLSAGQDRFVFMESMVNDPNITKVLIVCDETYMKKANDRQGGVGVEGTIMSSEIYASADQTKFIPIVFQHDLSGDPFIPIFLKSRYYLDLSMPDMFGKEYEELLRCIYNMPKNKRPEIGEKPSFLDQDEENSIPLLSLDKLKYVVQQSNPIANKYIKEYLETYRETLKQFIISDYPKKEEDCVPMIENQIEQIKPMIDYFLDFLDIIHDTPFLSKDLLVEFWQDLLDFYQRNNIELATGGDVKCMIFDQYRFYNKALFLTTSSFLIEKEEFEVLRDIVKSSYIDTRMNRVISYSFSVFGKYNYTLDEYKNRAYNGRFITVEGNMIIKYFGEKFHKNLSHYDILLYYLSLIYENKDVYGSSIWLPTLAPYHIDRSPILLRLQSIRYFEKAKALFDVSSPEAFKAKIKSISEPSVIGGSEKYFNIPCITKGLHIDDVASIN